MFFKELIQFTMFVFSGTHVMHIHDYHFQLVGDGWVS